jgi:hypothetical protein
VATILAFEPEDRGLQTAEATRRNEASSSLRCEVEQGQLDLGLPEVTVATAEYEAMDPFGPVALARSDAHIARAPDYFDFIIGSGRSACRHFVGVSDMGRRVYSYQSDTQQERNGFAVHVPSDPLRSTGATQPLYRDRSGTAR